MKTSHFISFSALFVTVLAQSSYQYVDSTCVRNTTEGISRTTVTTPHSYKAVLAIIGSFSNFTWGGVPPKYSSTNGTDNTNGTSRVYRPGLDLSPTNYHPDLNASLVVETLIAWSNPTNGPFVQLTNIFNLYVPSKNSSNFVEFYSPYDSLVVRSVCGGKASEMTFTTLYCANSTSDASNWFNTTHTQQAENVGNLLGSSTFTGCDALANLVESGGAVVGVSYKSFVAVLVGATLWTMA